MTTATVTRSAESMTDRLVNQEIADDWEQWYSYAAGCLASMFGASGGHAAGSASSMPYDGINRPLDSCKGTKRVDEDDVHNTAALAIERYKRHRISKPDIAPDTLRKRCIAYAARATMRGQLSGYNRPPRSCTNLRRAGINVALTSTEALSLLTIGQRVA